MIMVAYSLRQAGLILTSAVPQLSIATVMEEI